jgi:hypothetical protein
VVDRCAGAVLSKRRIRLNKLIEVFSGTTHVISPQALLRLLDVRRESSPCEAVQHDTRIVFV